ncbi:MAG: site-specific integrase [Bacteroidetes bacterium]|nr:site-specific integrase [Bacteroidota bacterium]
MDKFKEKNGQFPIVGRLIIERRKVELSTNIMVKKTEWDLINGQLKNKLKNHEAHKKLIKMESEILQIIEHREAKGLPITSKIIKKIYQKKIDKDSAEGATYTILQYFDTYISIIEKSTADYTEETVQHHRTTKSHLIEFHKSINLTDSPIHIIDTAFLQKFYDFLRTWQNPKLKRAMNGNSANKYMSKLRSVLHKAKAEKLISANPFEDFKLKRYKPKSLNLIDQEIIQIIDKNLQNESLDRVRDYLIMSIFMGGMRFSDLSQLKLKNIFEEDGHYFVYLDGQEKTENSVHTPLLPPAVYILKKYAKEQTEEGYILPRLSHSKLNLYLKTLGDICGINKSMTHKIARHSFATTICGRNGMPRHITSAWIGHVQEDTPTNTYAQLTKEESFKYLKMLWELYSKEQFLPKVINR